MHHHFAHIAAHYRIKYSGNGRMVDFMTAATMIFESSDMRMAPKPETYTTLHRAPCLPSMVR